MPERARKKLGCVIFRRGQGRDCCFFALAPRCCATCDEKQPTRGEKTQRGDSKGPTPSTATSVSGEPHAGSAGLATERPALGIASLELRLHLCIKRGRGTQVQLSVLALLVVKCMFGLSFYTNRCSIV